MYSDNPGYNQPMSHSGDKQPRGTVSNSGGGRGNVSQSGEKQTQGGYYVGQSGEKKANRRPANQGHDSNQHQSQHNQKPYSSPNHSDNKNYQQRNNQRQPPPAPLVPHPQLQHLPYVGAEFPFGLMSFKYAFCISCFCVSFPLFVLLFLLFSPPLTPSAPQVVVDPAVKYLPPVRPPGMPPRPANQNGANQQQPNYPASPTYNPRYGGANLSLSHSGPHPNAHPYQQQQYQQQQQQQYHAPPPHLSLNMNLSQQRHVPQSLPVPSFLGAIGRPHAYSGAGLVEDVRTLDHYQHFANAPPVQQQPRKKERVFPGMANAIPDVRDDYNSSNNSNANYTGNGAVPYSQGANSGRYENQQQSTSGGGRKHNKDKSYPRSPNPQFQSDYNQQQPQYQNNFAPNNYNEGNYDNYNSPNRKNWKDKQQYQQHQQQSNQQMQSPHQQFNGQRGGHKQNQQYYQQQDRSYPNSPQQSYNQQHHAYSTPDRYSHGPQHQHRTFSQSPPSSGGRNRQQGNANQQQYSTPYDSKRDGRGNYGNNQSYGNSPNYSGGKREKYQGRGQGRSNNGDEARRPHGGRERRDGKERDSFYDEYYTLEKVTELMKVRIW
jgi:hypothetical protein